MQTDLIWTHKYNTWEQQAENIFLKYWLPIRYSYTSWHFEACFTFPRRFVNDSDGEFKASQ